MAKGTRSKINLTSKRKAKTAKDCFFGISDADDSLARAFYQQVQDYHAVQWQPTIKSVEKILLEQHKHDYKLINSKPTYPLDLPKFNPSGASKCDYELYMKIRESVPPLDLQPYHTRWTRNATAVHEATQKDLLYMGKVLDHPRFKVKMTEDGLPCWERNILKWEKFCHKGQEFIINGMMDGMLVDQATGETIGFEFKTKSTTIATVGTYKMKDVQEGHKMQAIVYSCLFFGDPYEERTDTVIFMYESLAKDGWTKGIEAREDFRTFQVAITREMRMEILDKFARVSAYTERPEHVNCDSFFCPFKEE